MHHSRQQCLIAEWLGLCVTLRVRARVRECGFSLLFFFVCVKNTFVLHVNGSCDVHGVRTTTVCDITMMNVPIEYCKLLG